MTPRSEDALYGRFGGKAENIRSFLSLTAFEPKRFAYRP